MELNLYKKILNSKIFIDILIDFEDILDKNHIYVYDNWERGELIDGPKITKYYISILLRYPDKYKPDFSVEERLKKNNILIEKKKVKYYIYAKEPQIKNVTDIMGTYTRTVDVDAYPKPNYYSYYWLVEIKIPKKYFSGSIYTTLPT